MQLVVGRMHIAHIVVLVILAVVVILGGVSVGTSFVNVSGSNNSPGATYTDFSQTLFTFHLCESVTVSVPITVTQSSCESWSTFFSPGNATTYCNGIGTTGNVTNNQMLQKFRGAAAGGILYILGTGIHFFVFLVWSLGVLQSPLFLVPTTVVTLIGFIVDLASFSQISGACAESFCTAIKNVVQSLGMSNASCNYGTGFATLIASFTLFVLLFIPTFVFKRPDLSYPSAAAADDAAPAADSAARHKEDAPAAEQQELPNVPTNGAAEENNEV